MSESAALTLTVPVPVPVQIALSRRRGRKRIVAPDGMVLSPASPPAGEVDSALVKAIARAHRRRRMLERGEYEPLRELAKAERLDAAYVSRMPRLTLPAPELVEDMLEGWQPENSTVKGLIRDASPIWTDSRVRRRM